MSTQVKVYLESKTKKETGYPNQKPETAQKPQYELKFNVGYDSTNVYYQLSGGSQPVFYTINEEVANSMEVGKEYMITISPISE
jgi:hypothetical protein